MGDIALAKAGSISYRSFGVAKQMCKKFAEYFSSFLGKMKGWPMEYLYAIAAMVGIFPIMRILPSRAALDP